MLYRQTKYKGTYDSERIVGRGVFLDLPLPTSRPSSGSPPRLRGPAGIARSPGGPWRQLRAEVSCSLGWRPRCPCYKPQPDRPGCPDARGGRRSAGGCPRPGPGRGRATLLAAPPARRTAGLLAPVCRAAAGSLAPPWPPGPSRASEALGGLDPAWPGAGRGRASPRGVWLVRLRTTRLPGGGERARQVRAQRCSRARGSFHFAAKY